MLDRDIAMPVGWQAAWLDRTLSSLHCYTTITSYALSLTIIALGVGGFLAIRRTTQKLTADPSRRQNIFSMMNKKLLKITKGHFFIANIYMLNVFVITMVDAVISAIALGKDASSEPEAWNTKALVEIGLYCIYLLSIFMSAFILIPLLQMLLVTWFLARFSRKYTPADFIPEARFFSTHLAQIWSMMSFFVVSWCPPSSDNSLWRYVALQACFGSALGWLEASFAFNFRADKIEVDDLSASSDGVREILRMFTRTVKAVHGKAQPVEVLPRYETVVPAEVKEPSEKEALLS